MRELFVGAVFALSLAGACAQQAIVSPNANLLADGIPTIPQAIADKVAQYTEGVGHTAVHTTVQCR